LTKDSVECVEKAFTSENIPNENAASYDRF
jgi:hypothetical protein